MYGLLIVTPYLLLALTFHKYIQYYEKSPVIMSSYQQHYQHYNSYDNDNSPTIQPNLKHKSNFFPLKDGPQVGDKIASKINSVFIPGNNRHKRKDSSYHNNNDGNNINNAYNNNVEMKTSLESNDKLLAQNMLTFNGVNKEWGYFNPLKQKFIHQTDHEYHTSYRFRDIRLKNHTLVGYESNDEPRGVSKVSEQNQKNLKNGKSNKSLNHESFLQQLQSNNNNAAHSKYIRDKAINSGKKKAPRIRIKNLKVKNINSNDDGSSKGDSRNSSKLNYQSQMPGHQQHYKDQSQLGLYRRHVKNSITDKSINSEVSSSKQPATNTTAALSNYHPEGASHTPNNNYKPQWLSNGDLNRKLRTSFSQRRLGLSINHKPGEPLWNSNFPSQDHCYQSWDDTENVQFQSLRETYIYSAYLDERPDTNHQPIVRVFTVMKSLSKPQLFCHFPKHTNASTIESPISYQTQSVQYYELCENHGKTYGAWLLNCEVPSDVVHLPPCHVILSVHGKYHLKQTGSVKVTVFKTTPGLNYTVMLSSHNLKSDQVFQKHHSKKSDKSQQLQEKILHKHDKTGGWGSNYSKTEKHVDSQDSQVDVFLNKQDFCICVPPLFGYIPSTTLIQFIELSTLLGANHIVFYIHNVSGELRRVLKYYEQQGIATAISWTLPLTDNQIWNHGQLLAINDCLYRSMHRFKYVAFNDLDEFIVPKGGITNWLDMIQNFHVNSSQSQYCGYTFQSAFFDPISSSARLLYDLESDLRSKAFSKVRSKVMVMPDRIFELGIHHISRPIDRTRTIYYVNNTQAYIHHYRQCMTDFDPKMNCQIFARDESLFHYIPTLRHNVHKTTWILKDQEKQYDLNQRMYNNNIKVKHIL